MILLETDFKLNLKEWILKLILNWNASILLLTVPNPTCRILKIIELYLNILKLMTLQAVSHPIQTHLSLKLNKK
jgi:hypothetical protein